MITGNREENLRLECIKLAVEVTGKNRSHQALHIAEDFYAYITGEGYTTNELKYTLSEMKDCFNYITL